MEHLYFIDNNLQQTCKVIEALKTYYTEQTNKELNCSMILINIGNQIGNDTISYYKGVFNEIKIGLNECISMGEVREAIAQINKKDTLVMVDLHMVEGEEKEIAVNKNYKCYSMQCMDELEKTGIPYVWYSSYVENPFESQWQKSFQEQYKREIPKIYERKNLIKAHFKRGDAKEILGV